MQNQNFLQEMSPLPVFSFIIFQQADVLAGKFCMLGQYEGWTNLCEQFYFISVYLIFLEYTGPVQLNMAFLLCHTKMYTDYIYSFFLITRFFPLTLHLIFQKHDFFLVLHKEGLYASTWLMLETQEILVEYSMFKKKTDEIHKVQLFNIGRELFIIPHPIKTKCRLSVSPNFSTYSLMKF